MNHMGDIRTQSEMLMTKKIRLCPDVGDVVGVELQL